jgi:4-amino-4-deoxy-L-arabinose transferase-like glycosyltransferase
VPIVYAMSRPISWMVRSAPALFIIAAVAAVQCYLITRSLDFLLTNILPDDSFYYFEIARNIASGLGSTFDGLSATNGYHPLWLVILVPLFKMLGTAVGALEPIRAALALSVALTVGTNLLVYRLIGRFTQNLFIRLLAFASWALNPFIIYQTINGLETSLSLFCIALLFTIAYWLHERVTWPRLLLLGVVSGVSILARVDTITYVAMIFLWLLLKDFSWQSVKRLTGAGVVTLVVLAPWLIWNFTNFGMVLTSSSGANTLVNHTLIYQDNGTGVYQNIKGTLYSLQGQIGELMIHTGAPALSLLLLGAALALLAGRAWKLPNRLRDIPPVYAFIAGFILLFVLNVAVRWTARTWYFVSFGMLLSFTWAVVLDALYIHWPYGRRVRTLGAFALGGLLLFTFFIWWHKELTDYMPQQREMYAAAEWFNEHAPHARVGIFNAGINGYFSTAQVVNLDGLVNNDAYKAMQQKRLLAYMQSVPLEYVADFPIYLTYRYKSFWGVPDITPYLREVTKIYFASNNRSADGLHVYKLLHE